MRKKITILITVIFIIIIMIIGIKLYYTNLNVVPIDLYLTKENSEEKILATKGSYKWKEKGKSVIVDCISPLQMDFSKKIDVKSNEKLNFSESNWENGSTSLILAQGRTEIARVTIEMNLEENYIVIPEVEPGEYIIQINLKSEKGDVWYATKINVID